MCVIRLVIVFLENWRYSQTLGQVSMNSNTRDSFISLLRSVAAGANILQRLAPHWDLKLYSKIRRNCRRLYCIRCGQRQQHCEKMFLLLLFIFYFFFFLASFGVWFRVLHLIPANLRVFNTTKTSLSMEFRFGYWISEWDTCLAASVLFCLSRIIYV